MNRKLMTSGKSEEQKPKPQSQYVKRKKLWGKKVRAPGGRDKAT